MKAKTILLALLLALSARGADYSGCFFPGEVSRYKVSWMGIPLAWSRTTTESFQENGRSLILLRMVSKNYKTYSHIYRVDDDFEVVIDPQTALPLRFSYRLTEGSRAIDQFTLFDHAHRTATVIDRLAGTTNQIAIAADTRDIYTLMYTMRAMDFDTLFERKFTLFVEGQLYDLELVKHREKGIHLPNYGKVKSIEIEPLAEFNGLFLRKGKIMIWISKIKRRMITCMKTKVSIGKVTVKLQEVSGPGDDFWTRKNEEEE